MKFLWKKDLDFFKVWNYMELSTELRNRASWLSSDCPCCSLEPPTGNTSATVFNLDCKAAVKQLNTVFYDLQKWQQTCHLHVELLHIYAPQKTHSKNFLLEFLLWKMKAKRTQRVRLCTEKELFTNTGVTRWKSSFLKKLFLKQVRCW